MGLVEGPTRTSTGSGGEDRHWPTRNIHEPDLASATRLHT